MVSVNTFVLPHATNDSISISGYHANLENAALAIKDPPAPVSGGRARKLRRAATAWRASRFACADGIARQSARARRPSVGGRSADERISLDAGGLLFAGCARRARTPSP